MSNAIFTVRMGFLAATALSGLVAAGDGLPDVFDDHGAKVGIANTAVFLSLLAATVIAGGVALASESAPAYRVQLVAALSLLVLSALTVNSLGAFFFVAGVCAVLGALVAWGGRELLTPSRR
jgi:hypothetical protein